MKIRTIAGAIFLLLLVSVVYALPNGWRNEIKITNLLNDEHRYGHCCIVTDNGGKLHVAMRKLESSEPRCYDIDYYRSLDAGVTWSKIYLATPGGKNWVSYRSTDITTSDNEVMIVFQHADTYTIYFLRSTDSGSNWGNAVQISGGIHPRIVVDGDYLHTFYSDQPVIGNYEIYRKYSTDSGSNWSDAQRLTDAIRNSWHPAVSVNANTIHLVWADNQIAESNYEIYYNRSTDHGANWQWGTSGYRLTRVAGESEFPDVVAYSDPNYNAVHVVWQDDRTDSPGVWYRRSTNNGVDWQDPIRLFANGHHPAIAADERGLYVVWEKDGYINYRESTDWGTTWQAPVRVTNTTDADSFPDIFADDLGRHIVFARTDVGANRAKIWYKQRDIVKPSAPQNLHKEPFMVPPPVVLYWNKNTEPDIDKYRVYRKREGQLNFNQIGSTTDTTFTDNNFPRLGCWYYYYVTAVDLANNESNPSNIIRVWVPDPTMSVDLGNPEPSVYTIERAGYYQWGISSDSTVDYGGTLRYCFNDLVPEFDYAFGFMLFEPAFDSGRVLSISASGYSLDDNLVVPESAQVICFRVPRQLYASGVLDLAISGVREAVLSQIFFWENISGGGPQSKGSFGIEGGLKCRLYPIPAQGKVSICYELPVKALVSVEIYDCLGRLVYRNKERQECGLQQFEWDTKDIPVGVYYVIVKDDNSAVARKVLILRR